jgi:orotidine-5'-phosphate decarboxylase
LNKSSLIHQIKNKKSFLCVGLDTDMEKLPGSLPRSQEGLLQFNRAIIDATAQYAVAFKINTAFYECLGSTGWDIMQETLKMIPPDIFTIADAKRGDIGNTSGMYARAFFENMSFDSVTVNPYMGRDSVSPFLEYPGKWAIILALTSNAGGTDFQLLKNGTEELYKNVLRTSASWGSDQNTMYVVGATKAEFLAGIRQIVPDHFLLVPGVGAQGGNLEDVVKHGANKDIGLLINASRSILYASSGEDYAEKAGEEALKMQIQMSRLL